jgi:hypothetical protein
MRVFISYTRPTVKITKEVSRFHDGLETELLLLASHNKVFLDTEDIHAGSDFPDRLRQELTAADVLLPLITPAWFKSDWCRREFAGYMTTRGERPKHVIPIIWVHDPHISPKSEDPIRRFVANRQILDWSTLRHRGKDDPEVSERLTELAKSIIDLVGSDIHDDVYSEPSLDDFSGALPGLEYALWALPREGFESSPSGPQIVRAVFDAIDATTDHLLSLRGSDGERKPNKKLRKLWEEAALQLMQRDPHLARILIAKAHYWSDPDSWDEREMEHADISMKNLKRAARDLVERLGRA